MRALIYDTVILSLTAGWYRAVIDQLPEGARLLDVGIGTGSALFKNADAVAAKKLDIVGVDIDRDYVKACNKALWKAGLGKYVRVYLQSVYDHAGGPYDAVYFSASFMLLPDPVGALAHVASLLAPDGRVFITQTFEERPSPVMEKLKPMLGRITTIEFGRVNYEADFRQAIDDAGLDLVSFDLLGRSGQRTYRLAVTSPR